MKEYRALRERHKLLEIIQTPELSCQVTLQPIEAFDLDAAIIFADILPPLGCLGLEVGFFAGEGPAIANPIRTAADVQRLPREPLVDVYAPTLQAIELTKREIGSLPLIGFSGAPFTLGCCAVEGETSRDFLVARELMFRRPEVWHELMDHLTELVTGYLLDQARSGADALQLFDTWAGILSPSAYRTYALPYVRRVISRVSQAGCPLLYFSATMGGREGLVAETGADVVGVDWRVDLGAAWTRLGSAVAVQGNLDPAVMLADWPEVQRQAEGVLKSAGGRRGHIFNLGHGVLPATEPDTVRRLAEYVHGFALEQAAERW